MNVETFGQVFTPPHIVSEMLQLRKSRGSILEPSSGDGAFLKNLQNDAVGIEIDPTRKFDQRVLNMDFFDYSTENKFDTIIGNPPYVRFQDIELSTKFKLDMTLFDQRTNLYLFFIHKSIQHLKEGGELIFITPKEFLKATSSVKLNEFIFENGTITDLIDYGDTPIFKGFSPNVIVWRFEKGNFSRNTNVSKKFTFSNGQLYFTNNEYSTKFSDYFFVKVGAVSGADKIFEHEDGEDFVCSYTRKTGKTKKLIFEQKHEHLEKYKDKLIQRKIKKFDEGNWWKWGRLHFQSDLPRIYVNSKTRQKNPFFLQESKFYDGSILAIFPKWENPDLEKIRDFLNSVDWDELGFITDGRYIFSQRSLENSLLPLFENSSPHTYF
jgi:adenine-specific DNA-methyltransferase